MLAREWSRAILLAYKEESNLELNNHPDILEWLALQGVGLSWTLNAKAIYSLLDEKVIAYKILQSNDK